MKRNGEGGRLTDGDLGAAVVEEEAAQRPGEIGERGKTGRKRGILHEGREQRKQGKKARKTNNER